MAATINRKHFIKTENKVLENIKWPSAYLYKFISYRRSKAKTETVFDNMGAVIRTTPSKNGKYTSVSVNVRMASPDAIIVKYKNS